MAEKHSPESRSSAGSSTHSTPVSTRGVLPDVALVVRRQPPKHVYSEEWFDVDFGLDIARTSPPRTGDADTEFVATIVHYKTGRAVTDGSIQLVTEPQTIWFSTRGSPPRKKQKVRCQIKTGVVRRDKTEAYAIRLSPKVQDTPLARELVPVNTACITLVNHKIKVEVDEDWENIWYKDEGGRDKCMTIIGGLYDKHNVLLSGEQIPLKMTLFYATEDQPVMVTKQDIMRTIGAANQFVDPTSGKCTLRFRVEDVSKNHQGQDFRVEVAVDAKVKGFKDVAPGYCPPVNVRSKRNKRHRTQQARDQRQQASPDTARRTMYLDEHRGDAPFAAAELPRLREALKGVIHWTEEVVNGLCTLQWQVIGYHQNPDGSPDYNRPYHNIPNPEATMSRIMGMYSDSTREQLMVLLQAVDRNPSNPSPQDPYGTIVSPPPVPRAGDEGYYMQPRGMPIQSAMRPPFAPPAMHPAAGVDAFRDKQQHMGGAFPPPPPQHRGMPPGYNPMAGHRPRPNMPPPPTTMHPNMAAAVGMHNMNSPNRPQNRESEVAYVLAKQYKSLRTGERLGFPAYTVGRELLGFYRESNMKVGVGQFVPIDRLREDFGPMEVLQASEILQAAIDSKSEAVHALKDWGSIANLLDHALVYDWSKDIGAAVPNSGSGSEPSD